MRFARPSPDSLRRGIWIAAGAFLWSTLGYAAGLYPIWDIPFGMLGAIAGYSLPWAIADTHALIRKKRGRK